MKENNDMKLRLQAMADKFRKTELLLARDITGAVSVSNEPDNLFFSSFSEEDARAFSAIFDRYKCYSKENSFEAPMQLKNNIDIQCKAMEESGICPLELMLFSARIIGDELKHDTPARRNLVLMTERYVKGSSESVRYILAGWEWEYILCIVLEACGKTNDDSLIRLAISYSSDLVNKYTTPSNISMLKGYLTMLNCSQNDQYIPVIGDLYSIPVVTDNIEAKNELVSLLNKKRSFMNDYSARIIEEITSRNIGQALRKQLEIIRGSSMVTDGDLFKTLNSNIDISRKIQAINEAELNYKTLSSMSRNTDNLVDDAICAKLCKDIDEISRWLDRSKAYIVLGIRGNSSPENRERAISYLTDSLEDIQEDEYLERYEVPIKLALAELNALSYSDVFQAIGKSYDDDAWRGVVGEHLRFKRSIIERELFYYVTQTLRAASKEKEICESLRAMRLACNAFNGKQKKLNDASVIVDALEKICSDVVSKEHDSYTYEEVFLTIELIVTSCPLKANEMLNLLDALKTNIENDDRAKHLLQSINDLIKVIDPPSAAQ